MPDPAITRHLAHLRLRGFSETTIYARHRALTRLALALPVPLLEAETGHLMAWRVCLDISPDAVVHYVSHAQQFYAWAVTEGLIAANPAAAVPVPRVGRRLPRPISEADLMAVLDAAPPRVRLWIVLAAWAGLRACEIAYLRRENILDTARPPVILIAGDATKGRTERAVPLSVFVLAEIAAAHLPASGWAFRRRDGQPGPNKPWIVSGLANKCLHDAGIAASLHQLRHRFGSQAYHASHDLRAVQELLGHATPRTTAGYAAYDKPEAAAAVEALPVPRRGPRRLSETTFQERKAS
jgi:integrase